MKSEHNCSALLGSRCSFSTASLAAAGRSARTAWDVFSPKILPAPIFRFLFFKFAEFNN